ncbi:MAG: hypothetical protein GYB67_16570, partial [Chloroflexi bacterium]|nr:hypothetical protein [Chloroflexota bacterium]
MDKESFDAIVQQLQPNMGDVGSRQALVQSALFGSPVLMQIEWGGPAYEFTVQLVNRLYQYDVDALITVLRELRKQVG